MPTVPTFPRFASDDSVADVTEPLSALKDTGWVGGASPDRPAAQHMNWLMRQNYLLHLYWQQFLVFYPSSEWQAAIECGVSDPSTIEAFAYSPSLDIFVAVGTSAPTLSGEYIASSADLVTWTQRLIVDAVGGSGTFLGAKWFETDSIFLAWGLTNAGGKLIYSSTDGTTWVDESTHLAYDEEINALDYDPISALYVACVKDRIYTTTDPLTVAWTLRHTEGSGNSFTCLAIDPSAGIAVAGNDGTPIYRSTDMLTWGTVTIPSGGRDPVSAVWDTVAQQFIVVGEENATGNGLALYTSPDGATSNWVLELEAAHGVPNDANVPFQIGYNPDYGHILVRFNDGSLWAGFAGSGNQFSLRDTPPEGMTSTPGGVIFWNPKPASRLDRHWIAPLNDAVGLCASNSLTPIF